MKKSFFLAVLILLALLVFFSLGAFSAATTIGSDALVNFPTSALWNTLVTFRPGNGEVVDLNPPRFTWLYNPDPRAAACSASSWGCVTWAPKKFVFQVATDSSFNNLLVNKTTTINFYNFLSPFPTGVTLYWRIGYIKPLQDSNMQSWTLADNSYESTPYTWSSVHTFTISPSATVWDRNMLSDDSYLASKGAHPHILFNSTTRAGLYAYLQDAEQKYLANTGTAQEKDTGQGWHDTKTAVASFDPSKPITDLGSASSVASSLEKVSYVWQLTKEAAPGTSENTLHTTLASKHPEVVLATLADWYVASGLWGKDTIVSGSPDFVRALGYGYDWFYDELSSAQKASVRRGIDDYLINRFGARDGGTDFFGNLAQENPSFYMVNPSYSFFTFGASHLYFDVIMGIIPALAVYNEDPLARKYLDYVENYMIGQGSYAGTDGGLNQGKGYDWDVFFSQGASNIVYNNILLQLTFPEAKFNSNPFLLSLADWYSKTTPVGFTQAHEPWGDGSGGTVTTQNANDDSDIGNVALGRDLSYFIGSGKLFLHYQNEQSLKRGTYAPFYEELAIPYFAENNIAGLSVPATVEDTKKSQIYLNDGWATGCSQSVNTSNCFSNGVGFIMRASPRGPGTNETVTHSNFAGLSYQFWAYGAPITDAGENSINHLSKLSMDHYSVLVNGIGMFQQPWQPTEAYYSRFYAYKETPTYTYVAADGTNAYPIKPDEWNDYCYYNAASCANGSISFLTKAQRHLLFVKGKYFVVYDDLSAAQPATFSWLYHVPYLYHPTGGTISMGWPITTREDLFSLNNPNASFSYSSGNYYPNGQPTPNPEVNVNVLVAQMNSSSDLNIIDLAGPSLNYPSLYAGYPAGLFPKGTTSRDIGVYTMDDAACKYSTIPNTAYTSMTSLSTSDKRTHYTTISSLSNGTSYTYYIKCKSIASGLINSEDYIVAFSIDNPITGESSRYIWPDIVKSMYSTNLNLSFTTDKDSTCKYSTTPNSEYALMASSFTGTNGGLTQTAALTGLVPGKSYVYFVKCKANQSGVINGADFAINFKINDNPVRTNPITKEDFYAQGDYYPKAHTLWVSNKNPATSWHFMTVIYPQKPGTTAPIIQRIDDYTARVTNNDGSVDVISFNPATAAANGATIIVDLANMNPLPVSDEFSTASCNNNNAKDVGEVCDGSALSPYTSNCATYPGFVGGTLKCKSDCSGYDTSSCTLPVTCTSFTYSAWGTCSADTNTQTRTILSSSPAGCIGGNPVLSQNCTPTPGTICTQYPAEHYGIAEINAGIQNWFGGRITLVELIREVKIWKYCS